MLIKHSRKPVLCPVCSGVPYRASTETDPAETCDFCQRRGRVSQRAERAYRKRAVRPLPAALRL